MIKNYFSLLSSSIALISLNIYLYLNIFYSLDGLGSIGKELLFLFFSLGLFNLFIFNNHLKKIRIIKSKNYPIILFLILFIIKLILEDPVNFFSYILSTSGGILTFFIIGILSFSCFSNINKFDLKIFKVKFSKIFLNIYCFISVFFSFDIFNNFLSLIRIDSYFINTKLIDGVNQYQRTGDFILIFVFLNLALLFDFKKQISDKFSLFIIPFSTILIIIFNIGSSLIIGSNKAGILTISFFVIYILILFLSKISKSEHLIRFCFSKLHDIKKGIISLKLLKIVFFVILFLITIFYIFTNSDLYLNTRLSGYGEGSSSISARLELLNNFLIHFDAFPFFGNMNVHNITTGPGSYVHSIPFYLIVIE